MNDRRSHQRLLCAQFVGFRSCAAGIQHSKVILVDVSSAGACVQLPQPVPLGSDVEIDVAGSILAGRVRYCEDRAIGYFVGVGFDPGVLWSKDRVMPDHLLDPRDVEAGQSYELDAPDEIQISLLAHLPTIRNVAERIRANLLHSIDFDGLVRAGILGLLNAVRKHKPLQNNSFTAFANLHIRSAILDSLNGGCSGSLEQDLRVRIPVLDALASLVRARDPSDAADQIVERTVFRLATAYRLISAAALALPDPDGAVIEFRYVGDLTPAEIAIRMGITEPAAMDVLESGLAKIREEVAREIAGL